MKIAATQVSIDTSSFEIYISGCDGYCDKLNQKFINAGKKNARCHNHNIWDFGVGLSYNTTYLSSITEKVRKFDSLIEHICIMGGEPLLQDKSKLIEMLKDLRFLNKNIILFTRFESVSEDISNHCDYIKLGPYDYNQYGEKMQMGFKLMSKNQRIVKV